MISRHFRPEELWEANQLLAKECQLEEQTKHKNSVLRTAGEAFAVDIVNNVEMLGKQRNAPRYLIPSDQLGKVPLGALNVRDEVSVSARLQSLELNMKKVCSVLEGVQANPPVAVTSRLDGLEQSVKNVTTLLGQASFPAPTTFASIAGTQPAVSLPALVVSSVGTVQAPHLDGVLGTGLGVNNRQNRIRSTSPAQKRKADGSNLEDQDGFRRPGRPRQRKTAAGTSQVLVEGVGEYLAPVEIYIGNTDGRTNENTIKTVLLRCAAAVEGGTDLVVEKIELLTKEKDPRTKCWKVVVPFRLKSIMENDAVYPTGWKHRTFFVARNVKEKRPRLDQGET